MGRYKPQGRDSEIVTFFYAIFSNRIHQGMCPDDARKDAYDAVTLRYEISKGRLLNIISEQKSSRSVKQSAFMENVRCLLSELRSANDELECARERNSKLINLLEECLDGNGK